MAKGIKKNPWKTLSTREVYDNPWIQVEEHQVINPAGGRGIYGRVHYKNKAIGIVALDGDDYIWLVGQHRYPLGQWSWEIPEGGGARGRSPLAAAKRELHEETGLKAKSWKQIIRTHLSNSVSDEEGFIFLAQNLEAGAHHREPSEADMEQRRVPLQMALKMVLSSEITDSLSVMGILFVARLRSV